MSESLCWWFSHTQSCLTLCDSMDYSPPGSSVHGISQARILKWDAISFSRWIFFFNDNLIGKETRILFSFTNGLRASLYIECLIWRSNWTEGGPWFPWGRGRKAHGFLGHPGAQQGGGRAHSSDFCSFFFFLASIRTCLASVFSWLLTTFSLFDLLNVCFSSVFHTCFDSLPFPPCPGTSAKWWHQLWREM